MVELRACLALGLATALAGSAMAASAAKKSDSSQAAKGSIVSDHVPEVDGPVTTLTGPDGRTWAAWTYRASHEFDIAISSRDESTATWSAPNFVGRRSGSDEIEPALAVDSRGAVYVAFATANPPRVAITTLAVGSTAWSEPIIVSGTEAASTPALLLVGERLIVAYRTARGVGMADFPTIGNANQIQGIQDGPEPTDPLGVKDKRFPAGGTLPASSRLPLP
jgi:hypothetical protein